VDTKRSAFTLQGIRARSPTFPPWCAHLILTLRLEDDTLGRMSNKRPIPPLARFCSLTELLCEQRSETWVHRVRGAP